MEVQELAPPTKMQHVEEQRALGYQNGIPDENMLIFISKDGFSYLGDFGKSITADIARNVENSYRSVMGENKIKIGGLERLWKALVVIMRDSSRINPKITWFLLYNMHSLLLDYVARNKIS